MASATPIAIGAGDILTELECIICFEQKRLHLLPCAHRMCKDCIESLANEDGGLLCPICRKPAVVRDQGFPVCLLSEYLRDQVKIAKDKAEKKSEEIEKDTKSEYKKSSCEVCSRNIMEAYCDGCKKFLCFRCCAVDSKCVSGDKKHDVVPIDQIIVTTDKELRLWKERTTEEVTSGQADLDALNSEKTKLESEISFLQGKLKNVQTKISARQREVDGKASFLKAVEIFELEADEIELIRMTRQICGKTENESSTPSKATTPLSSVLKEGSPVPKRLTLLAKHQTKSNCTSVSYHSLTGNLLLGCVDGMMIYCKESGEVTQETDHDGLQVAEHKGEVFISYYTEKRTIVNVAQYNMDSKRTSILHSHPNSSSKKIPPYISISDHLIASVDSSTCTIQLIRRQYQPTGMFAALSNLMWKQLHISTVQPVGLDRIIHLLFTRDGSLLVTGKEKGIYKLNKYVLPSGDNQDSQLIWSCAPGTPICGVAEAECGLIFAHGYNLKVIFFIGKDGKILSHYSDQSLITDFCQIDIRGDELAVADWSSNSVTRFRICW